MKILFKNANIIDSDRCELNKNVLVNDGVIESIFGQTDSLPEADEVYDLRDKWLMPGMVDMHTHLNAETGINKSGVNGKLWRMLTPSPEKAIHFLRNAQLTLMAGFTTVRNCGHVTYYTPEDVAVREAIYHDVAVGPNVIACAGFITMTAGHGDLSYPQKLRRLPEYGMGERCFNGPWECVEGVREKVRNGADFIKVMASGGMGSSGDEPDWPNFTVEELSAIVSEAHALKRKVAAHTHCREASIRCIEAGIDTIEHGCGLTDDLCEMMVEKGLYLIPTMRVVDVLVNSDDKEEAKKAALLVDDHHRAFRSAIKTGVKMAYGTDSINALKHGENGLEILNMREGGMSSKMVFDCLTSNAADALGKANVQGYIREGYNADLIVTAKQPVENIEYLSEAGHVELVMVRGKVVKNTMERPF
ncbi:MAG: amidohydrolase family protein [Clostridia bacterium]|nr:amidohydrolase family protein [Clostridia bacterium]